MGGKRENARRKFKELRKVDGALRAIRIPRCSLMPFFNDLALLRISRKCLKFRGFLFSIPAAHHFQGGWLVPLLAQFENFGNLGLATMVRVAASA
jgi:hypothetical protein